MANREDINHALLCVAFFHLSSLVESLDMNHHKVPVLVAALALLPGYGDSGNRREPQDSMLESVAVSRTVAEIDAYGDSSPNEIIT